MEGQGRTLRTPEAAKYLGIRPNTLDIWRCQKKGPKFHRLGRSIIYLREDLDAYLESRGVQTLDSININKKNQ